MQVKKLIAARDEANRFLKRVDAVLNELNFGEDRTTQSAATGAVRRSSMDLTRSLAELRKA